MRDEVKRIVYDPISWIHPQRFSVPNLFSSTRCRSILNDIVLHHYGLSNDFPDLTNCTESYLVRHWAVLAKAAFMAVCHRHRSALAYQGMMLKLDPVTLQFTQSELTESRDEFRGKLTLSHLNSLACKELMMFSSSASQMLKERIPLLFPYSSRDDENISLFLPKDDSEILIRMAIQYAKRNS